MVVRGSRLEAKTLTCEYLRTMHKVCMIKHTSYSESGSESETAARGCFFFEKDFGISGQVSIATQQQ